MNKIYVICNRIRIAEHGGSSESVCLADDIGVHNPMTGKYEGGGPTPAFTNRRSAMEYASERHFCGEVIELELLP